jgi:hypothetical protein
MPLNELPGFHTFDVKKNMDIQAAVHASWALQFILL